MFSSQKRAPFGKQILISVVAASLFASYGLAQVADGNVVGSIFDPSGALVPNAQVQVENVGTGVKATVTSDSKGGYRFNNLLVGIYNLTVTASGFSPAAPKQVAIELSKTATANITLTVEPVTFTVDVRDTGVLIDTTTAQISNIYAANLPADLPVAGNPIGGYLNLSLLGAGVASSGGIGAGTGPSIGGMRPRNNNFTIEGVDNNRKDITGPLVSLPNDAVSEFTVLQNQFSAEFGHSSGGQFNAVIQNGSNNVHGTFYEYLQNRNLNSMDQLYKRQGFTTIPRSDYNLFGGSIGGPIVKNKLFFFGNIDYNPVGFASTTAAVFAPTSAGYSTLASIPGVSQTNLGVLQQYLGSAPQQSSTVNVSGNAIPIGTVPILAPSYANTSRWLGSMDYTISDKDQLRGRYISNYLSRIDTTAAVPTFWSNRPTSSEVLSLSEFHNFRPNLINEVRLAYNRFNDNGQVTNAQFPGLDMFPNIVIQDLGNTQIGPNPNLPQATIQNTYQLVDNVSWIKKNHSMKFGFEGRDVTSWLNFVSKIRGDYEYTQLQGYVLDNTPDFVAQRTVGGSLPYSGNSRAFYGFADDDWKVTHNFSLSLGVRYEYNGVARSMQEFALNSIANVPGVLTFFAPQAQTHNFVPRFGFAYSPGKSAKTSIRGGFGMAYDQYFDNIGSNVRPPQVNTVVTSSGAGTGYLANGGILANSVAAPITQATARAATTGWFDNQKLPYALNWNFGVQHVFGKDYTVDVRYLGTRGVHLILQTELNRNSVVTAANSLPTYLVAPSQATLDNLPLTLTQLNTETTALSNPLAQYGFSKAITTYGPQGDSVYHGLAVDITKRFSSHLFLKTGYTWSHNLDNSTMEINFTSLSPRRPQDFGNLAPEWASSALDRRHRLTFTWLYSTPWFEKSNNWLLRNVLGNYQVAGTYTFESPEYVTPQSTIDANLNSDSATDRVIVNTAGIPGTGTGSTALKNTSGQIVAYVATNPNAEFIQAQKGAYANAGRNILPTQGINNVDFNIIKSFSVGERKKFELRADFYNGLNHPQYTPGKINNVTSTASTHVGETVTLNPASSLFGAWDQVYSSNPRVIQIAAKFTF